MATPASAQIGATAAGALVRRDTEPTARASDSQVELLARLVHDAQSFLVRARAAMSLAHDGSDVSLQALEQALRDPHSAVRAAAAASLEQVGQRRSVPALRRATADQTAAVADRARLALRAIASRAGISPTDLEASPERQAAADSGVAARASRARHAVVLGEMKDRSGFADPELSKAMADHAARAMSQLDDVLVVAESEIDAELLHELSRRRVPMYRLEGNLQSVVVTNQLSERHVRCEVTLLLLDEPGRTLRSMMRGAATGVGLKQGKGVTQSRSLARTALRSAVRTALSSARSAIDGVAHTDLEESDRMTELTPRARAASPAAR